MIAARPNPRDPWPVAGPAPTFREGRVFPKFRSVGGRSMALADRPTTHLHTLPPSSSTANIFPKWRQISIKATQSCTSQTRPSSAGEKFHSFQLESNSFEWEFQAVRVRMKQVHSFKFDQSVGPIFHGRLSLSPHKSRDFEFKKKRRHFISKKSTSDEKEVKDAPGFLVVRQEIGG